MSGINKAILVGRLGKDPEAKLTRDGKEFSAFSMATSKRIKEEEKTTWHNVVVWNEHTAKYVNDFAVKGTMVYVEGEIDNRTWDKPDGTKGYATDIVVGQYNGTVQIVADGRPRDEERAPAKREAKTPSYRKQAKGNGNEPEPEKPGRKAWDQDLDDEIPF